MFHKIYIYSKNDKVEWSNSCGSNWDPKLQFPSCTSLDINDLVNLSSVPTISRLMFAISKSDTILNFYVEDKKHQSRRPLMSNRLAYKGPPVTIHLHKPKAIRMIYSIRQFIDSEEDKQKKCRNYPNKDFVSFKECDEHFINEKLRNEFKGVVPFWMSNDFGNVTLSK